MLLSMPFMSLVFTRVRGCPSRPRSKEVCDPLWVCLNFSEKFFFKKRNSKSIRSPLNAFR